MKFSRFVWHYHLTFEPGVFVFNFWWKLVTRKNCSVSHRELEIGRASNVFRRGVCTSPLNRNAYVKIYIHLYKNKLSQFLCLFLPSSLPLPLVDWTLLATKLRTGSASLIRNSASVTSIVRIELLPASKQLYLSCRQHLPSLRILISKSPRSFPYRSR